MKKRRTGLRTRLGRLGIGTGQKEEPAKKVGLPGPGNVRKRLERMFRRQAQQKEDEAVQELETAVMRLAARVSEAPVEDADALIERMPASLRHGTYSLTDVLHSTNPAHPAELGSDQKLAGFDPRKAVYLDTETTGLSGGAGMLIFLIGMGYFEGDSFVMHQELVHDFEDEGRALAAVAEVLERYEYMVTFNGKAFDVDRLRVRFTMSGQRHSMAQMPHLDLLYPARRLLGLSLRQKGCSLKSLETSYLGFQRGYDIESAQVPKLYYEWLRTRRTQLIGPILQHNKWDILSLVTLTAHLLERVEAPVVQAGNTEEIVSAARFLLKSTSRDDRVARAREGLERAIETGGLDKSITHRSEKELSLLYRKEGRWKEAAEVWERMADRKILDPWPVEELAKCYEHRLKDLEKAEYWAQALLKIAQSERRRVQEAEKRLARVRTKRLREV